MAVINQEISRSLAETGVSNEKLVVAVSGGPDSQVLLSAISHVSKRHGVKIFAVGIDHCLRNEANAELDLAEGLAQSLSVPFHRFKVTVSPGASVQAMAREARYAMLNEFADDVGARYITTAHHYDDRAETVLIRLLRGKNIGSMGVLPVISGRVFRPMLKVTRQDVMNYCKRWDLKYATDPSNSNDKYLRVKIRNEILPLLEELNPQIRSRLNDLADEALFISDHMQKYAV